MTTLCQHDRRGASGGSCPAGEPGDAAGGCAFDGAMITLTPITDAAHLVHGPISCLGNSWNTRNSLSSGPTTYRRAVTTDLSEQDIIHGGEGRLLEAIEETARRLSPAAIFVYATCVTAMTGEDLTAVCSAASAQLRIPVVAVHSPGFAGSKNFGNRLAGQILLDQVIGTVEPDHTTPVDVALVGEYNIAGELWNVLPVLDKAGLRVLSRVTGDARYRDVAVAHRARATMVVCSRALLGVARGLHDRYGIPWFEGSFYGMGGMRECLRQFAELLDVPEHPVPGLREQVESVIEDAERQTLAALLPYRRRLAGTRAVLYTGGVKSWSMISALREVGVEVVASGATKSTPNDVQRMRALMGEGGRIIEETGAARLLRVVQETRADLLIAGGRNQYTAIKARLPFLDVNQERHTGFAGYSGLVELARRLDLALSNPVWTLLAHEGIGR